MPIKVIPSGESLGATVEGLDLAHLSDADADAVVQALGRRGVIRFPNQSLAAADLKNFSARLGDLEINVIGAHQEPGLPEVMILSNVVKDGKQIGLPDAGQGWHTDMSYSKTIAFANVLYALEVPQRDGNPLGATQFCDMCAAWDGLPDDIKRMAPAVLGHRLILKPESRLRKRTPAAVVADLVSDAKVPITDKQREAAVDYFS